LFLAYPQLVTLLFIVIYYLSLGVAKGEEAVVMFVNNL